MNILLVDDDKSGRAFLAKFITRLGHSVTECGNGQEALMLFKTKRDFQMVLSDIRMPYMSGEDFLRSINDLPNRGDTSVVLMSAYSDVDTAVTALRLGAYDYLVKPVNVNELAVIVERIQEYNVLRAENRRLTEHFDDELKAATEQTRHEIERLKKIAYRVGGLEEVGFFSDKMQQIMEVTKKFHRDRSVPVLIQGETGSGKEVVAKLIHYGDEVNEQPFVDLNCAALTANLFESELFGYEAGAFTGGLTKGQKGKMDIASGGTLFLDEIGEMPLELQGKLLRVLQEKQFYRVGGLRKTFTDIRIICATNADLERRVKNGTFREDLYYRLKVGHIQIPPLRERPEDIIPLAKLFLEEFSSQKKRKICRITEQAAAKLQSHSWPGNVRELKNTIDLATLLFEESELRPEHITFRNGNSPKQFAKPSVAPVLNTEVPDRPFSLEEFINRIILQVLEIHDGNKTETAKYLGMSRRALCYRLDNMKN